MANVVGTWNLTTDWGCDGSITGSFTQTFNANGTWTSTPFVHNGTWFQVECMVIWTFADTPHLVYAGNVNGSWIEGIQGYDNSALKGCFGGRRPGVAFLAEDESKAKAAKAGHDPTLGK